MQKILLKEAEQYTKQNQRRRIWRKFVQAMACVVVFCTTYALILPAITMEKNPCDLEEHTHSESCYEKVVSEGGGTLACTYKSLGVHVHTQDCYNGENLLICGQADYLIHKHNDDCLDENGRIVCRLPEVSAHVHTDACYRIAETEPMETESVHTHGDDCYGTERAALICQTTETEGHSHGESCFTLGELVCQLAEQEGHIHGEGCSETVLVCELTVEPHVHGDGCYQQQICDIPEGDDHTHTEECLGTVLICDMAEQPHTHTDACYQTNSFCDTPESEGHSHSAACYESLLTCEISEKTAHYHTDACYEMVSVLICELEEGTNPVATTETEEATEPEWELICTEPVAQVHIHSADCFVEAATEADPLTCTIAENHVHEEGCYDESGKLSCTMPENHTHSSLCYGTWNLVCTQEEHIHDLVCQNDPEADVETQAIWTATFADIVLTGEWDADLLAIAQSQLGYQESTRNYEVMEDGETIKGYTRYGDWYGMPYGDWCAMFVSFCLNYADIPRDVIPYEASCPDWIEALQDTDYDLYRPVGEYTPVPGDLVFFDWEEDGISDHVGIVAEMIPATEEEPAKVKTIEGKCGDCVMEQEYGLDDSVILGYGQLPEKPLIYCCDFREHSHDAACLNENGEQICGMREHTHLEACTVLTEDEWDQIRWAIEMIDGIPSDDEIYAKIEEFEAAEDYDGEDAWLGSVYQQVSEVYHTAYAPLSDEQKACVTNADKLLQLEYIWSAATFAVHDLPDNFTVPVVAVNRRVYAGNIDYQKWQGHIFTKEYLRSVAEKYPNYLSTYGSGGKATDAFPYYRCHVIAEEVGTGRLYIKEVVPSSSLRSLTTEQLVAKLGEQNGFFLVSNSRPEGGEVTDYYVTTGTTVEVYFDWKVFDTNTSLFINPNPGTNGYYEYHTRFSSINLNVKTPSIGTVQGGSVNARVSLFNYDETINDSGSGNSYRLSRAGYKFYNSDNVKDGKHGGPINPNEDTVDGIGPGKAGDYTNPVMYDTLTSDGYPQANKDGSSAPFTRYFDGTYLKATMTDGGGLFRQDSEGYWYYDSKDTAAYYNAATGRFTLYDCAVSPSYGMSLYARKEGGFMNRVFAGNFLPFNDINEQTVRDVKPEIDTAKINYGIDDSDMDYQNQTYVALKQPVDLWFGMTMDIEFFMPKDGTMNGKDMVFDFRGDDDVFVYIGVWNETLNGGKGGYDYRLVLDIGGTHAARSGTINFATGAVTDYPSTATAARTRTLKSIFGLSGATFEDYTKLSLKFYYMERGGNISYCRLCFNMPVLAENSLSVTKELTGTADAEMLGNPDFRFQVLHANEDGSKTEEPFIGEGVPYTIYDAATNIKVGTGTTGANGVFTIKAGQRAEFEGIVENSGKYYVRELLDTDYFEQYGEIRVDGEVVSAADVSTSFKGVNSPVKDASSGTTFFTFNNHVDVTKLGYLTVTKNVPGINVDQQFKMIVKLNDVLLPAGTEYILYDTDAFLNGGQKNEVGRGTVSAEEPGIILVKDGETAWIDAILPGTTFHVSEDSGSAKGYYVSYNPFLGDQWMDEPTANGIGGVVPVKVDENAHVCVEVKNTPAQGSFEIPVTKIIPNKSYDPNTAHIYNFSLELVYISSSTKNYTASELGKEHKDEITITVDGIDETTGKTKISGENKFQLSYVASDFQWTDTYLTYKITENKPDEQKSTHDSTVYYATVKVTKSGRELTTSWYALTKDEPTPDGTAVSQITFTNTLLGDLSLQKIVSGGAGAQESGSFDFTIRVDMSAAGMQGKTLQVVKNGQSAGTVTADANGIATLSFMDVKHNDKILLRGIPAGSTWTITETNAVGYIVSWTSNGTSGAGNVATGNIPGDGMEVVFTNTVGYELPQTGGAGTTSYTMAGLVLILLSMAYLMYRPKARGKGNIKSP